MGFEDSRSLKPNGQWVLLELVAKNCGQISWQDSQANTSFRKKKQILVRTLKSYFGIEEDPFYSRRTESLPYQNQTTTGPNLPPHKNRFTEAELEVVQCIRLSNELGGR